LNRPTEATAFSPLVAKPVWKKVFVGTQILIAVCLLTSSITEGLKSEKEFGRKAPQVPLYGVYNTTCFIKNQDTIRPSEIDTTYWKQLVVDGNSWSQFGKIEFSSGKKSFFEIKADTAKYTLSLKSQSDTTQKYVFKYKELERDQFFLEGIWAKDSLKIQMTRYDLNNFLLHKEKFTWIEE
jgi:hypothetical protein